MGRKVKTTLDPATSVTDDAKGSGIKSPGRKKRGRPSKEEIAERERQEAEQKKAEAAQAFPKEEARAAVAVMLALMAKGINGEPPTDDEVSLCTEPAHAVALKYGFSLDKYPEIALLGALVIVGQGMRQRRKDKSADEEKLRAGSARPEGERQKSSNTVVPAPASTGGGV